MSQKEFGDYLGISQNHVSQIEKGTREPSEQLIKCLCYCFNLSEMWVTTGEGEMFISPEDIIKQQMARIGERAFIEAVNLIMKEKGLAVEAGRPDPSAAAPDSFVSADVIDVTSLARRTYDKDPELKRMIDILNTIFSTDDERFKNWASFQFDCAFPPDKLHMAQKKHEESYRRKSASEVS